MEIRSKWSKPELTRYGTFREVTLLQGLKRKTPGTSDDFMVTGIEDVDQGGGS
jgi:hypothetical protein